MYEIIKMRRRFLQETYFNEHIEQGTRQGTNFDIFCCHGSSVGRGWQFLYTKH